jgi:tubulin polyglutamylase TTLL5
MTRPESAQRHYSLTHDQPGEEDHFLIEALDPGLWQPANSEQNSAVDWDMRWTVGMPPRADFAYINDQRFINHIPGNGCLTVKSALADTVTALTQRLSESHGPHHPITQKTRFIPQTFSMPRDLAGFRAAAAADPDAIWLQKPKNSSRGRGIRLLTDPEAAPTGEDWLVQRYIAHPHHIDDRKYVLRLYVLIRGLEPLRVYRYRQGFAKLASHRYTLDDLTDPYVHQTNPDINATNTEAKDPVVFIDLDRYCERLEAEDHDSRALFARIDELLAITAIAGRETMRRETLAYGADPEGCFELMGIDCLVDEAMQPWLMECNLSPSLGVFAASADGGEAEARFKRAMVDDLVSMLGLNHPSRPRICPDDPPERLTAAIAAEQNAAGGYRLLYPAASSANLWPFFDYPRPADAHLADRMAGDLPRLIPW